MGGIYDSINFPVGPMQGGQVPQGNHPTQGNQPAAIGQAALQQLAQAHNNITPESLTRDIKSLTPLTPGYGFLPTSSEYQNMEMKPSTSSHYENMEMKEPGHSMEHYQSLPINPVKSNYVSIPDKTLNYTQLPPETANEKLVPKYSPLPNTQLTPKYASVPKPKVQYDASMPRSQQVKLQEYKLGDPVPQGMKILAHQGKNFLIPKEWKMGGSAREVRPEERSLKEHKSGEPVPKGMKRVKNEGKSYLVPKEWKMGGSSIPARIGSLFKNLFGKK